MLHKAGVQRIAVNAARDISFSSGLHAAEAVALRDGLGREWSSRFVVVPMLGVEFVGSMVSGRLGWYRKLQETAWAAISEAFSERVITPGTTTTTVSWSPCLAFGLVP